jgi:hypothetical protein
MSLKELFRPTRKKIVGMILLALIAFMSLPIILSMVFVTDCSSVFCKTCYGLLYIVGLITGFPGTLLWLFRFSSSSWSFIIQLIFDYVIACLVVHYYIDRKRFLTAKHNISNISAFVTERDGTSKAVTHAVAKKKHVKKKPVRKKAAKK